MEMLRRYFERALALAHAAIEEPTPQRIEEAQGIGADVLALAARARPAAATLAEGHILFALASRLRALLEVLEAPTATPPPAAHELFSRA